MSNAFFQSSARSATFPSRSACDISIYRRTACTASGVARCRRNPNCVVASRSSAPAFRSLANNRLAKNLVDDAQQADWAITVTQINRAVVL
eukprot:7934461-Pyramimonas_sp.AAC.1